VCSAEFLGVSGGVAALAFGLTLNNYSLLPKKSPQLYRTKPSSGFNRRKVFVSRICVVVAIYGFRWFLVQLLLPGSDLQEMRDYKLAAFLAPKGLAAAVLATLPSQAGLAIGPMIEPLVYAVVVLSIVSTSILVWWSEQQVKHTETP